MNEKKFRNYDITLYERFNQLRLAIYSSPQQAWTVKKMASFVNLSPSYVQSPVSYTHLSYLLRTARTISNPSCRKPS